LKKIAGKLLKLQPGINDIISLDPIFDVFIKNDPSLSIIVDNIKIDEKPVEIKEIVIENIKEKVEKSDLNNITKNIQNDSSSSNKKKNRGKSSKYN